MQTIIKFLNYLFCEHHSVKFIRGIYGDPIIFEYGNKRSVWKCNDCSKILYSESLTKLE